MDTIEPFKLERYFARHEFSARRLLCSSDCETRSLGDILAFEPGSEKAFFDLRLGYTETRGAPSLREAITTLYASSGPGAAPGSAGGAAGPIGPGDVFVHAGAEEAILNLCLALVGPGDHVVVNSPAYQSLEAIPRWRGAAVSRWELREEGSRWRLDPDDLAALLAPKTKLVIMNAPHNPTGALPTREEFDRIVALCRRAGALLLVDEVYRGLERDPERALPPACLAYENGISLNVLSKTAGLAGLRIGWLATRRTDVLDAVALVKDYNTICSSGPSEFLAEIALRNFGRLAAENRELCAANLALFGAFMERHPDFVAMTRPEGSSIAFPRLAGRAAADFGGDAETLALALLADTGILILPGKLYGYDARYWRLGYGRADFAEGLSELESWLQSRAY
ncbi:MAG TPA: aminotransferase class I/II-fold pyridoxal phosphate-dependent enzyme [Rectinemataceae bacterium]|nr:aminotransferase class I/II-fold pyridoxal phosphate-dependent enzyme [Rectinemataceae bacterium]